MAALVKQLNDANAEKKSLATQARARLSPPHLPPPLACRPFAPMPVWPSAVPDTQLEKL